VRDYPLPLRRIRYHDVQTSKTFNFLTNNFAIPAQTVADLYRYRRQVELFFKWIKQHLRIKSFFGTSENALKNQIWIAISVYILVAIIKNRFDSKSDLYTILQILSLTLLENTLLALLVTLEWNPEAILPIPITNGIYLIISPDSSEFQSIFHFQGLAKIRKPNGPSALYRKNREKLVLVGEALYEPRHGSDFLVAHTAGHVPHHPIRVVGTGPGAEALEGRVEILGVLSSDAWEFGRSQTGTGRTVTTGAGSNPGGRVTAPIDAFAQLRRCEILGPRRLLLDGIIGGDVPKILLTEGNHLGIHLGVLPCPAFEIHQLLVDILSMLTSELGPGRNQGVSIRAVTGETNHHLGLARRGVTFRGPARCLGAAGNERRCNRNRNQPSLHGVYRLLLARELSRQRQVASRGKPTDVYQNIRILVKSTWRLLLYSVRVNSWFCSLLSG